MAEESGVLADREEDGWLVVSNRVPEVKYTCLLLPGLLCTDLIFHSLLKDPQMIQDGILLEAANPPGFKGQPLPPDFRAGIKEYATLVENFLAKRKYDLVVGHSFFGNVLIEISRRANYKGTLVLISPSLQRSAEPTDTRLLDWLSRKPILRNLAWSFSYKMLRSLFKPYFVEASIRQLEAVVTDAKLTPSSVAGMQLMGFFNYLGKYPDLSTLLSNVQGQIWYVRGENDNIILTEQNRNQLAQNRHIKLVDIPGSRHFVMLEKPKELGLLFRQMLNVKEQ
ncbi:MAG: alpha/beta hydrolase [Deltaproteobacteria bacterium]|nr:alpha/beta hydrolase [Deltaproteobacteria bacterium]